MLVVIGLQPLARRAGGLTDLPPWTTHVVGAGVVVALLAPSLGGGARARVRMARRRGRHPRAVRRTGRGRPGVDGRLGYDLRVPAISR